MRLERKNHGNSHSYTLDGEKVPGVTTVIGVLDKPALVAWAAQQTAAFADDNWSRLSEMRSAERLREMEQARFNTNRVAVVRGNRVHALGDRIAHGETVDVPIDLQPYVEPYARMLDQWQMSTVFTEAPVAHTAYRYAGTLDLVVESPRFGRSLLDIKTGKRVYPEVALQLNAYANCDLRLVAQPRVGPRGGKYTDWIDAPMPRIDTLLCAHLMNGSVELVPVELDDHWFDQFLHMLDIFDGWVKRTSYEYRDDDAHHSPIGEPIWPEDAEPLPLTADDTKGRDPWLTGA